MKHTTSIILAGICSSLWVTACASQRACTRSTHKRPHAESHALPASADAPAAAAAQYVAVVQACNRKAARPVTDCPPPSITDASVSTAISYFYYRNQHECEAEGLEAFVQATNKVHATDPSDGTRARQQQLRDVVESLSESIRGARQNFEALPQDQRQQLVQLSIHRRPFEPAAALLHYRTCGSRSNGAR